ncbi:nuclear transport factor 2 family protein [Saccharopolyspora pogona]|uniref:nuclear transport factor 2 family protein n=1 Tax=Saccharopolyspora pogona TaxID=333966 RepID=UPI0016843F55|nr:nuclear transport factor 2 family protein [Saccharopolyspora pogona]
MVEIQFLYNTYNHCVDMTGDAAGVADCFLNEGTWEHPLHGKIVGREAITAFMQKAIDEQEARFQHWNANLLVDVDEDGDSASATAYVMTLDTRAVSPVIWRANIYRDRLVRTAEGWRFASRRGGFPFTEFRDEADAAS